VFDSVQNAVSELVLFRKNILSHRASQDKPTKPRRRSSIQQLYHAVEQKIKNISGRAKSAGETKTQESAWRYILNLQTSQQKSRSLYCQKPIIHTCTFIAWYVKLNKSSEKSYKYFQIRVSISISSFNFDFEFQFRFRISISSFNFDFEFQFRFRVSISVSIFRVSTSIFDFQLGLRAFTSIFDFEFRLGVSTWSFNFAFGLRFSTSSFDFDFRLRVLLTNAIIHYYMACLSFTITFLWILGVKNSSKSLDLSDKLYLKNMWICLQTLQTIL